MGTKKLLAISAIGLTAIIALQKRRRPPVDLTGQTALITGGSRGLGLILAHEFAADGCRIVICARDERELERARASLAQRGAEVLAIPCDVSDQRQVEQMVDEATRRFGGVDILVNNAGIIQAGPLRAQTVQDFEDALGVMFWGMLYPTLAVLPQMRARHHGRIVNITSVGGKVSVPHLLPYNSAKFAAVGLSQGLRAEVRNQGITVTTIAPGLMRTGSYLNGLFKGNETEEFTWFALGSSLPLISMDAERAARQIVRAAKRGEAERVLSVPATLLTWFHGLFPGLVADLLSVVATLVLPGDEYADPTAVRGDVAQAQMHPRRRQVMDTLTTLGRRAADRYHQ